MHRRILAVFKDCVRNGRYVVTLHAEEEMNDDGLDVFDVENAVWTGKLIQRQRDRETDGADTEGTGQDRGRIQEADQDGRRQGGL